MRPFIFHLGLVFLSLFATGCSAEVEKISPADAARRVAAGEAVLIDVREPTEWAQSGVAAPAVLLPQSEFDANLAGDWKPFLEKNRGTLLILYCRSGRRSATIATALTAQGYRVANAGGFKDWEAAGLPVRKLGPKP